MVAAEALLWLVARVVIASVMVATAWAVGERLTRGVGFRSKIESFTIAVPLGLAAIAMGLFLLGLVGRLSFPWVVGLGIAAHLLALDEWRSAFRSVRHSVSRAWLARRLNKRALRLCGVLGALPVLLLPLYPPTEYDALVYHLPYAQGFVDSAEMPFFSELLYPYFPPLQELLFAGVMLFGTDVDAQVVSLVEVALVACLLLVWGREVSDNRLAGVALAFWVGTPLVVWHAGTAYVDIGLALFGTASLYSCSQWQNSRGNSWAALAAAFAAAAAAVKYLGLFFLLYLALVFVLGWRQRSRRRGALVGLILMTALAAPCYLRIWAVAGNPLFPYYPEIFGPSAWDMAAEQQHSRDDGEEETPHSVILAHAKGIAGGLGTLVMVPYDTVFRRERYSHQAPFTPWLLLLIPTAGVVSLWSATARRLLLPVGLYCLAWLITTREPRFLLVILPSLGIALTCGCGKLLGSWRRQWLVTALLIGLALPGPAYGLMKLYERGGLPLTEGARQAYLTRIIPGYGAVAWLNHQHGSDYSAYSWRAAWLTYHADGRMLGTFFGPYQYRSVSWKLRSDPQWGVQQLRRFGVEYLVRTVSWSGEPLRMPGSLRSSLQLIASGPGWEVWQVPQAVESG
jgi:hypothetical protein